MIMIAVLLALLLVAAAIIFAGLGIKTMWTGGKLRLTFTGLHAAVVGLVFLPAVFGKVHA